MIYSLKLHINVSKCMYSLLKVQYVRMIDVVARINKIIRM